MKVMMALENVVMDGVKRASTVLANALTDHYDMYYYSLADAPRYFELDAPLIIADPPTDPHRANFFGSQPYEVFADQIGDMLATIERLKIDMVILPAGLLTSFAPLIRAKLPAVGLIGWMHNNYDTYVNDYYGYMRKEFRAGLRAVDTLVTLTESDFHSYSAYNQHTVKIYNPITIQATGRANLDTQSVAFTGRIAIEHKGIDLLLEATRNLYPGWHINIAGSGDDENMAVFNQLMDFWHLHDRVHFRGPLKDAELTQHYEDAAIFASTSRWEGMPLVIGEAMAFGLPIVAMENTGSREFIGNDEFGIITRPGDPDDFMHHLNRMIANRELRKYYAEQSLKRAQDFNIDKIVADWRPIIERLPVPEP
ncbi:glycosyltransferase [Lacticaseibacillus thailandensis]|nr:glycosyltransferase [Lacticaseibacillus thailandensis]